MLFVIGFLNSDFSFNEPHAHIQNSRISILINTRHKEHDSCPW